MMGQAEESIRPYRSVGTLSHSRMSRHEIVTRQSCCDCARHDHSGHDWKSFPGAYDGTLLADVRLRASEIDWSQDSDPQ